MDSMNKVLFCPCVGRYISEDLQVETTFSRRPNTISYNLSRISELLGEADVSVFIDASLRA